MRGSLESEEMNCQVGLLFQLTWSFLGAQMLPVCDELSLTLSCQVMSWVLSCMGTPTIKNLGNFAHLPNREGNENSILMLVKFSNLGFILIGKTNCIIFGRHYHQEIFFFDLKVQIQNLGIDQNKLLRLKACTATPGLHTHNFFFIPYIEHCFVELLFFFFFLKDRF